MNFAGEFETHLTITAVPHGDPGVLAAWANVRGLKFVHIVLDRGAVCSQPMLTRAGRGDLPGELAAAAELARRLAGDGFDVVRTKIEAAPWNEDVPASDAAAAAHPGDRYFEHHVKLVIAPATDTRELAATAVANRAHLSRNARRTRADGRQERFVTQRCFGVGRSTARSALDALLTDLTASGYAVAEVEEEFVVYDSNLGVDAGWIVAQERPRS